MHNHYLFRKTQKNLRDLVLNLTKTKFKLIQKKRKTIMENNSKYKLIRINWQI
jgi:hypothetical protein